MTKQAQHRTTTAAAQFAKATAAPKPNRKPRRSDLSPLTLRLTAEERARLEELAAGMTLSAYIRACIFAEQSRRQKRRPKSVVADKKLAAEALGLLGQSRIASNLNQLAHHANLGILIVGETEKAQIAEAHEHLRAIRGVLMGALGKTESPKVQGSETAASHAVRTRSHHDHSKSPSLQPSETAASRCARTRSHRDHSEVSE